MAQPQMSPALLSGLGGPRRGIPQSSSNGPQTKANENDVDSRLSDLEGRVSALEQIAAQIQQAEQGEGGGPGAGSQPEIGQED